MNFRGFPFVATLVAAATLSVPAFAQDLPLGYGVFMPNGSKVTTSLKTLRDTDPYVFEAYPGQTINAKLKVPGKKTSLNARIVLIRPDGTEVLHDEKGRTVNRTEVIGPDGEPVLDENGEPVTADTVIPGGKYKLGKAVTARVLVRVPDPANPGGVRLEYQDKEVRPATGVKFKVDEVGVWTVLVRALDEDPALNLPQGDPGTYTVSVKNGNKVPGFTVKNPEPVGDEFVFAIPAKGGGTMNFKFAARGAAPVFKSLTAPGGADIDVGPLNAKAKKISSGKFDLAANLPQGLYRMVFGPPEGGTIDDVNAKKFVAKVTVSPMRLPNGDKKRKGTLSSEEPRIINLPEGVAPLIGGPRTGGDPGTRITITALDPFDDNEPYDPSDEDPGDPNKFVQGKPRLFIGGLALENVRVDDAGAGIISGEIPPGLGEGTFPVSVETATGQVSTSVVRGDEGELITFDVFTRVPPPVIESIDPVVGAASGGFTVTITGSNFRPGDPGGAPNMVLLLGNGASPGETIAGIVSESETEIVFNMPSRAAGFYTIGVLDKTSNLRDTGSIDGFEYLENPGISSVTPKLLPALPAPSDTIFIKGSKFRTDDEVWMENAQGVFEEQPILTTSGGGGVQGEYTLHTIAAPFRPTGSFEVEVRATAPTALTTTGDFRVSYFSFADLTPNSGLPEISATDPLDAWTTAIADYNKDEFPDLFLSRVGEDSLSGTSLTRVLRNDGTGRFTDVTDEVMPPLEADDDWRADGMAAKDLNQDGFPDLVLVTNSTSFPMPSKSHVRLLISERSTQGGDRIYRNRTADLMAPPRPGKGGVSNSSGDNWRGLAMHVGDIDLGPPGPPEILITHEETKQEIDVTCGNYCSSNIGGALYRFYWGASRMFRWDAYARGGQGQFKFDANFFPRASGVLVPIGNPPPGAKIRACNTGTPCADTFTPFMGHSIEVGDLNADRKPDIVVVTNETVSVDDGTGLKPTSSTQVAINRADTKVGSAITDVTSKFHALGPESKGDSVGIARLGYPNANSFGSILVGKNTVTGGESGLRVVRFVPPADPDDVADFEDITGVALPGPGSDSFQAAAIDALDVDGDGDQDVIIVADAAPSGVEPAFRILRNNGIGILTTELGQLVFPLVGPDFFDGTSLLIGDVDRDGANDFTITRSAVNGPGTQTRIIRTDKD